MARKKGTKVKKAVQKILDKTTVDEKVIGHINENRSLYNKILCYTKCYGGYLLAIGAGCTFGVSLLWGTILLAGAAGWAYTVRRCKPCCKGGVCEPNEICCD